MESFRYHAWAQATKRVYEPDGSFAPRGSVGGICDLLPFDSDGGYVVVDFPEIGPTLCDPNEVRPT